MGTRIVKWTKHTHACAHIVSASVQRLHFSKREKKISKTFIEIRALEEKVRNRIRSVRKKLQDKLSREDLT